MEEEGERGPDEGFLLVRIHVPELNVQKCLQFPRDQLVWDAKQQCLAALPKELKESFNYGLYSPPENGRAGKFLDEERRLCDYPFNDPVGYLELKYKRRVYKALSLDEKQLKSLHTKANLRRFVDYVQNGHVEKITKMCLKGLDPNFHCQDSGETPLTLAACLKKSTGKVLMALVNGGALLDYRTRDGSTAMHRSVEHNNLEAMKTLLELGASPNYKDAKGLTPLYLTITHNVAPEFTETLLHDHATTGTQDLYGWQEVHQACKNGQLKHLEHLLFYGADMNATNASGNTPLHVCAVNNQENCARQLLFRGADREALNYTNQNPCQVAVIATNMELADIIQNYRREDVVPYRGPPSYNPKRRSALGWLTRAMSMSTLALPPSPCPSDRSSVPFSSACSSLSDGSSSAPPGIETDTASIVTDKSLGDTSDIISDSSGVGTANSDITNCSLSMPGATVVCMEPYTSNDDGYISIREGDIIEVSGTTDDGFLEGTVKGDINRHCGLFPACCVQEVKLRHQNMQTPVMVARDTRPNQNHRAMGNQRVLGRRESTSKHYGTAPRVKKPYAETEPRTVVLHRGKKGFGFILRGAKATSPLMALTPSDVCPALQYLDDVDPGGVADMAGLRKGDFLLAINLEDVSSASHERVVDLIRNSGDLVQMTVMGIGSVAVAAMPVSKSTISVGAGNASAEVPPSRQYATLPRKLGMNGRANHQAPLPPRRDPKTMLSVGKARAKSMVAGLERGEKDDPDDAPTPKSSSAESIHQPDQPRTASIRQRPTSSRITPAELEELFQTQKTGHTKMMTTSRFQENYNNTSTPSSPAKGRTYASVSEMKRINKSKCSKVRFTNALPAEGCGGGGELRRDFHSTPDLVQDILLDNGGGQRNKNHHRSQENLAQFGTNRALPPPNHPPPPPPPMLKSPPRPTEYDNLTKEEGVMSSFRPTTSAKLYASPEDAKMVGYRSKSLPAHSARPVSKSHSMRTSSTTFKPSESSPNNNSNGNNGTGKSKNNNPYAQPIKTLRSHSNASDGRGRRRRVSSSSTLLKSGGSNSIKVKNGPPSPEPDYSCSDSESGGEGVKDPLPPRLLPPGENSGNSNASGSSSSSSSVPHSFSVEEIKKGRSLLKSSKSYPDNILKKSIGETAAALEDGDNSSSGVSSDQEVHTTSPPQQMKPSPSPSPKIKELQRTAMLSRNAVSLAKLPPPLEADVDEKEEFCLPPPPEFDASGNSTAGNGGGAGAEQPVVLAPPPQFSDNREVTRVRIVGALPKGNSPSQQQQGKIKQGRLHSQ